jgi:hypothetical protein
MSGNTRRRILRLYWGSMATGALLPLAVDLVVATTRRAQTPAQYLEGFYLRLFAPQESVLMLALLGGAPCCLASSPGPPGDGGSPRRAHGPSPVRAAALPPWSGCPPGVGST